MLLAQQGAAHVCHVNQHARGHTVEVLWMNDHFGSRRTLAEIDQPAITLWELHVVQDQDVELAASQMSNGRVPLDGVLQIDRRPPRNALQPSENKRRMGGDNVTSKLRPVARNTKQRKRTAVFAVSKKYCGERGKQTRKQWEQLTEGSIPYLTVLPPPPPRPFSFQGTSHA